MEDVITNYWRCLNPSGVHGLLGLNRLVLLVAMGLRSPLRALLFCRYVNMQIVERADRCIHSRPSVRE